MREATTDEIEFLEVYGYSIDDCECTYCPDNEECPFSFDPYNTFGDCLAMK